MTSAVQVDGLAYSYPDGREALKGVDLSIESGARVALLGPNGAGKTTLALHLNGILRAASGSVTIGSVALSDSTLPEIRRRVGLVFQDANDQLFMPTVREDVAFGPSNLGLRGDNLEERVTSALESVDGSAFASRPPHHLSGGEKRRASLATVLAMEPDVLVFDEPSSGLDPTGRRELIESLRALPMTQVVITHDMPLALELCPDAAIMNDGVVVAAGRTVDLLDDADLLTANRLELPYRLDLRRGFPGD